MANTNTPGSSPPEILEPVWHDIRPTGSGSYATWTQKGLVPRQLDWEDALGCAKGFYDYISQLPNGFTGSRSCVAAALVALYQERDENGNLSQIKSVVFISSIPRGDPRDTTYGWFGRLAGPNGGHPKWRNFCYHWGPNDAGAQQDHVTKPHAEDVAINMLLNYKDVVAEAQKPVHWLDDMSMLVYGIRRAQPGGPDQVSPCGVADCDGKFPCCQRVLDRMGIKWRFGNIPPRTPTPEPQLPQYPPNWSGGNGGGGDHHGSHASSISPACTSTPPASTVYSSFPSSSFQSTEDAGAGHVQQARAWMADARKTGRSTIHSSPSKKLGHKPDLLNSQNTYPIGTGIRQLTAKPRSLSDSLAKMSLGGGTTQQAAGTNTSAVHVRRAIDTAAADAHPHRGAGAARATTGPPQVNSAAPKRPPAAGRQVVAQPVQTKPVTAAPKPNARQISHVRQVDREEKRDTKAINQHTSAPKPHVRPVDRQQKPMPGKKTAAPHQQS